MLKKHWAFFRQGLLISLQYRSELMLWILISFAPFVVLAFVWQSIFTSYDTINGFTLSGVLQYYLLVVVIERLTACHFEQGRSDEIRSGKIDHKLIKPYSYIFQIIVRDLSMRMLSIILFLPVLLSFFIFLTWINPDMRQIQPTMHQLAQFPLLILVAYIIQFCTSLIIVFLTFWFEGSSGLEHFKWIIFGVLGGSTMPYDLMPEWLKKIISLLPFKYLFAVPIGVVQGTYKFTKTDLVYLSSSIILILIFCRFVWIKGKLKYASAGG